MARILYVVLLVAKTDELCRFEDDLVKRLDMVAILIPFFFVVKVKLHYF